VSKLDQIGIKIVEQPENAPPPADAVAVLHEIVTLLQELLANDEGGVIDLQELALIPTDYELLREALPEGEVSVRIDSIGPTEVRETIYPGVWWLTQYNVEGDMVVDMLEITLLPEILQSHPDDVKDGLLRLQEVLTGPAHP